MTAARGELRPRILVSAAALSSAVAVFSVIVWIYGEPPLEILSLLLHGTWGTSYGIGQVLFKASPLLATGVAVSIALRAGLFNVGAEGQLAVASLASGLCAAALPAQTPFVLAVPLVLAVSAASGALWALLPAVMKTRYSAHEVITTIMMNQIATAFVGLAVSAWGVHGTVRTRDIIHGAHLARLGSFLPMWKGSALSVAFVGLITLPFLGSLVFRRTLIGREIVLVGQNPIACEHERIPLRRRTNQAMLLSGAVAGLGSAATVLGYKGYFEVGLGAGAGFGGLAVALLSGGDPVGVVLAALLFGTLEQGGLAINGRVPMAVMDLMQGVIIVAVALGSVGLRKSNRQAAGGR